MAKRSKYNIVITACVLYGRSGRLKLRKYYHTITVTRIYTPSNMTEVREFINRPPCVFIKIFIFIE